MCFVSGYIYIIAEQCVFFDAHLRDIITNIADRFQIYFQYIVHYIKPRFKYSEDIVGDSKHFPSHEYIRDSQ